MTNVSPDDVAQVRSSGRLWLVTSLRSAAFGAPPAFARSLAARADGAADRASVLRLRTKLEGAAGAGRTGDDELQTWLENNLASGRLTVFDITPDEEHYYERRFTHRLESVPMPGGLSPSIPWPRGPMGRASPYANRHRCAEVLNRARAMLEGEARVEFEEQLVPETFARASAALWRWAGDETARGTPLFEAPTFAIAYQAAGWMVFEGLDYLAKCAKHAVSARNDDDLDDAAQQLKLALDVLGVRAFFLIARQAPRAGVDAVNDPWGTLHRWSAYIETLNLSPVAAGRGALWGTLSPRGQLLAVDLARRSGRTTLSNFLQRTDFSDRFRAEFGAKCASSLTRQVWEMASGRFLRQLRGRPTVYVEESGQARTIDEAQHHAVLGTTDNLRASDALAFPTQLAPTITEIEVVNVSAPSNSVVITRGERGR